MTCQTEQAVAATQLSVHNILVELKKCRTKKIWNKKSFELKNCQFKSCRINESKILLVKLNTHNSKNLYEKLVTWQIKKACWTQTWQIKAS